MSSQESGAPHWTVLTDVCWWCWKERWWPSNKGRVTGTHVTTQPGNQTWGFGSDTQQRNKPQRHYSSSQRRWKRHCCCLWPCSPGTVAPASSSSGSPLGLISQLYLQPQHHSLETGSDNEEFRIEVKGKQLHGANIARFCMPSIQVLVFYRENKRPNAAALKIKLLLTQPVTHMWMCCQNVRVGTEKRQMCQELIEIKLNILLPVTMLNPLKRRSAATNSDLERDEPSGESHLGAIHSG